MALWPFAGAHASSVTTSVLGFVAFFFQWGLIHMMLRGPTCNAHGSGVRAQAAQQGARKLEWLYLYQLASRFRAVVPGVIPKSEYEADSPRPRRSDLANVLHATRRVSCSLRAHAHAPRRRCRLCSVWADVAQGDNTHTHTHTNT